jgi:hypothetical protein
MGGHPYYYAVPYERNVDTALQALRKKEFEAGRYNPVVPFLDEDTASTPSTGKEHDSIEEALAESNADGTRSILDIERIGAEPDYGVAVALSPASLKKLYGTDKPTRAMVDSNMNFFGDIDRGQGIYFVLFDGENPSQIFFAGMSYD